jgi:hypothetical protein
VEWTSGLTLDESCLDFLWPNEVALPVFLAGATLAKACSTDRLGLGGLRGGSGGCLGIVGSGSGGGVVVVTGRRWVSGRFAERPEPRKISVYTTKRVGSGNSGYVEIGMGSRSGRPSVGRVGVCERRIEVEDVLRDEGCQTWVCGEQREFGRTGLLDPFRLALALRVMRFGVLEDLRRSDRGRGDIAIGQDRSNRDK